jgi:hypothetical protein
MIMNSLIDKKKKEKILKRIHNREMPLCALPKPAPEEAMKTVEEPKRSLIDPGKKAMILQRIRDGRAPMVRDKVPMAEGLMGRTEDDDKPTTKSYAAA